MIRQIKLGLSMRYLGYHAAAWRHPDADPGAASKFEHFCRVARMAEAAKFDMLFLADGIGIRAKDEPPGSLCRSAQNAELEPITLLSALAVVTQRIGLVATASTTYNEPFHVARKYASLDHISGGRAGWNIVTSWSEAEARNFNRDQHLGYDERYERAAEFVEVVKGLWDSWEADAFPHDKASGIFFDPGKLHVLGHEGKHFKVRGPLSVARTPQGRPILVQAGASEQGLNIAAANADVVYAAHQDIAAAKAYYADLKGRVASQGRSPDHLLIMPGVTPFVGRTRQEARDKFDLLNATGRSGAGAVLPVWTDGRSVGVSGRWPGAGAEQSGTSQSGEEPSGDCTARQSDHPSALYAGRGGIRVAGLRGYRGGSGR